MSNEETIKENAYTTPNEGLPAPTFLQFFSGLAGEVLIHLGMYENPITRKRSVNLPLARYTIDLMGLLEEKTKGNLTKEEEGYIKAVLYDLRMRFVDASRKEPKPDEQLKHEEKPEEPKSGEVTGE